MKYLALMALFAATPAYALDALTTTQSPPAGNSSQSTPEPANSLPPKAGTQKPKQTPGALTPMVTAPEQNRRSDDAATKQRR